MKTNNQEIILGGGCFWCTEAVFEDIDGVAETTPGYSGGRTANPSYEMVVSGGTGHAEVLKIVYNPKILSLLKILQIFFTMHDPTSLNKQGNDMGTQYRSVIFYETDEQKKIIDDFIKISQKEYSQPIVTEIKKVEKFFPAQEYHHNYFKKNTDQAYCTLVIAPKIRKVKESFNLVK